MTKSPEVEIPTDIATNAAEIPTPIPITAAEIPTPSASNPIELATPAFGTTPPKPQSCATPTVPGDGGVPGVPSGAPHYETNLVHAANSPRCAHVKADGSQCGSPALKERLFCYFHDQLRPPYDLPLTELAPLEDANGVQVAITQVTNALLQDRIDLKRANALLYGLHAAATNVKRVSPGPPPAGPGESASPMATRPSSKRKSRVCHYRRPDGSECGSPIYKQRLCERHFNWVALVEEEYGLWCPDDSASLQQLLQQTMAMLLSRKILRGQADAVLRIAKLLDRSLRAKTC